MAIDGRGAGFTLIELIFVLALLAISAGFIAAHMGGFFRGRALNFEARRILSLTHYGHDRAIAEGAPVVLWVNSKDSTYGLRIQSTFSEPDSDDRANTYAVEPSLTLETQAPDQSVVSEQDDEMLGLPDGTTAIRFNPDGFVDPSSVQQIIIRQGTEAALAVRQTPNGLGYEILPVTTPK